MSGYGYRLELFDGGYGQGGHGYRHLEPDSNLWQRIYAIPTWVEFLGIRPLGGNGYIAIAGADHGDTFSATDQFWYNTILENEQWLLDLRSNEAGPRLEQFFLCHSVGATTGSWDFEYLAAVSVIGVHVQPIRHGRC